MQSKVYHYAHLRDWEGIKNGSWKSRHMPGLGASRRVGREHDEAFNTGAVWALLEPMPKEWTENLHFKDSWKILAAELGPLLLEIDVDDETNAFVIDRGHMEGFLNKERSDVFVPEQHLFPTRKEAEKSYLDSKVRIQEYLEQAEKLKYTLPEVIFPQLVPFDKISVSEQQPFMDKLWEREKNHEWGTQLIRDIREIPELNFWLQEHKAEIELAEKTRPKPREFKFR